MINRDVQRVSNELMYCNIYLKVCLADVCTVMRIQQQDISDILNGMFLCWHSTILHTVSWHYNVECDEDHEQGLLSDGLLKTPPVTLRVILYRRAGVNMDMTQRYHSISSIWSTPEVTITCFM